MRRILTFALLLTLGTQVFADTALPRPKQYVLISFDGSYSHNFWVETLDIANKTGARFSYFISGVYFLKKENRNLYDPPRHKIGASDIGFGESDSAGILQRTDSVWSAIAAGHDIGSHANGHFDGSQWDKDEWTAEFSYFKDFTENTFTINKGLDADYAAEWPAVIAQGQAGFRAPLLAENLNTRKVLKDFNYLYDASGQAEGKWPSKKDGIWDLTLSRMILAGTKKKTVAMDYNIYFGQCNGKFTKGAATQECQGLTDGLATYFENQTYLSYISTFLNNYYGNRAPLSIGHHFSAWNKGAYWRALQRTIYAICTQPEVECITHRDLVGILESNVQTYGASYLTRLNQGDFDKSGIPDSPGQDLKVDLSILKKVALTDEVIPEIQGPAERMMLKGDLPGAHADELNELQLDAYRINPATKGINP